MIANCPSCGKTIHKVGAKQTDIQELNFPAYYVLVFTCKSCNAAIGAQIDPTVQAELVASALKKAR